MLNTGKTTVIGLFFSILGTVFNAMTFVKAYNTKCEIYVKDRLS